MRDYLKLPIQNILKESQTTSPKYCDKKYIIYINPKSPGQKIRINTDYFVKGDTVTLCRFYDRGLCNTIEEYQELEAGYIESQAYGSWMDGAR